MSLPFASFGRIFIAEGRVKHGIADVELRKLPDEARVRRAAELVAAARRPPNGELVAIEREIERFEHVFQLSTDSMRVRVGNGSLRESHEICRWLMLVKLRDELKITPRA